MINNHVVHGNFALSCYLFNTDNEHKNILSFQALCFYNLSGASIDPDTLKHVAKVCADVDLSDHVVAVMFTIFDEDGDGQLSNKVF